MPKITAKPTADKVKYPNLVVEHRYGKKAITYDEMKSWLGMESEEEYRHRNNYEGDLDDDSFKGQVSIIEDDDGNKYVLHNNASNREFNPKNAHKVEQDVLSRQWAGPTCMPGETVNGEPLIISRAGRCLSIQHRGVGFIWAVEKWRANPEKYPQWKTEPVLDSLVVLGVSDSNCVVQTIDSTLPRSTSDILYTTGVFDDKKLSAHERKELSRKLAGALQVVWNRTRVHEMEGMEFQTHSTTSRFLGVHKKLLDCVKFVFDLDSGEAGRLISGQRLNAGEIAGLMYLFAATDSDLDKYLSGRSEKRIDFNKWDKAEKFIKGLATGENFEVVRDALSALANVDDGEGLGGRSIEKHAVLVKAWNVYKTGKMPTADDLVLEYGQNSQGNPTLTTWPRIGGIDQGDYRGDKDKPPTQEEIEKAKKVEAEIKAQADAKKVGARATKKEDFGSILNDLKEKHPKKVLLFLNSTGEYVAWDDHAKIVGHDLDLKTAVDKDNGWMLRCIIPSDQRESSLRQLAIKSKIALVEKKSGKYVVTDYKPK